MSIAVLAAVLVAGGVYLVLQRGLIRIALGIILLGHAANIMLVASGGVVNREPPVIEDAAMIAGSGDPLPQAFVLTAIVISFGVTVFLVALAGSGKGDDTEDGR